MALGILNNIASIAAENSLTLTSTALNSTLEQLSTGSRINTGADDAAGLAIANALQANVTALTQSVSNANNGVGELQLADGALAQVTTLLNRAVTLATESATGTVSDPQRTALQAEYSSILAEINRVGSNTTYDGQAVFQSGSAPDLNAQGSPTAGALTVNSALTVGGVTTISAGSGTPFTYTAAAGPANPNTTTSAGAALTAGGALVSAGTLTLTRAGGTTTFTTGAGTTATVANLIAAINSGVTTGTGTAAITVAGTDAHTNYHAALVGGQLQITDNTGSNDLAVTGFAATLNAGTTSFADSTAPTVQNLLNAINNDTSVGAKAVLSNGNLVITDPSGRNDLAVTTTDTVLGASVAGAPTAFTTPNTTGVAVANPNQLLGSATGLTGASTLGANAVYSFDAGGKVFSFTANAGNTNTVGDLLSAINNPTTDPAGLSAFLNSAGSLVVVDPNNSGNLKIDPTNTGITAGTLVSPLQTGAAAPINIFLSDATGVGSSQISVEIRALNTGGITNGTGGNSVNLSTTDLSHQSDAQTALTSIDSAIANIASVRGTLGASVNRLTAASNVINSQVQNLTSAENTITAADIPSAVANLTKYSILEQTGISALAQANQQQQLVLKLLQ